MKWKLRKIDAGCVAAARPQDAGCKWLVSNSLGDQRYFETREAARDFIREQKAAKEQAA